MQIRAKIGGILYDCAVVITRIGTR